MNMKLFKDYGEKIYLILLVMMVFLNLSIKTHRTQIYLVISIFCILLAIVMFLLNIKNIAFKPFSEVIFLFCVINILSYVMFNQKKNSFDILNIINLSLALNYFSIIKRKEAISIDFISNIILVFIVLFNIYCLLNNNSDLGYLKGMASHQNQLAAANVIGVMISFDMSRKHKNIFYVATAIMFFVIIYLTKSRNSLIIAMFFVFTYIWCVFYKKTKYKRVYTIISSLIVLMLILIIFMFRNEIMQLLSRSELNQADFFESMDTFTSGRWGMWTRIFPQVMSGHWLLGRGILNLPNIIKEMGLYNTIINKDSLVFWHNFIIDTIFNGGIIALFLLVAIFGLFIKMVRKAISNNINVIYYIAQIISILALCMLDIEFIWGPHLLNIYLFILLGNTIFAQDKGRFKYE